MSPVMFLIIGLVLIWLVFKGRALAMWRAMTGTGNSTIDPTNIPPVGTIPLPTD